MHQTRNVNLSTLGYELKAKRAELNDIARQPNSGRTFYHCANANLACNQGEAGRGANGSPMSLYKRLGGLRFEPFPRFLSSARSISFFFVGGGGDVTKR